MNCYGKRFGRLGECDKCKIGNYCRAAADPPLLVAHPPSAEEFSRLREQELAEPFAGGEEEGGQRGYTRADLLEVIGFMMALDVTTLEFLDAKLGNPDISFSKLARKRNISRQAVHKFIRERCEKIPELAAVMRNRSQKQKSRKASACTEEAPGVRKKTPAPPPSPEAVQNCAQSLRGSKRNFNSSNTTTRKNAAAWRNG